MLLLFFLPEILEDSVNQNILWDGRSSKSKIFYGNQICKAMCIRINRGRTLKKRFKWLSFTWAEKLRNCSFIVLCKIQLQVYWGGFVHSVCIYWTPICQYAYEQKSCLFFMIQAAYSPEKKIINWKESYMCMRLPNREFYLTDI